MMVTKAEMVKIKVDLLKQMNSFIINLGDETILETWLVCGIPDQPNEDDFLFFANDKEEWNDICNLFGRLVKEATRRCGQYFLTGPGRPRNFQTT